MLRPIGIRMRPPRLYSSAAQVTDSVCQWLEHVQTPFFAWAHYMDIHWPYHMEEALVRPRDIAQAWQDLAIMYGRSNYGNVPITAAQRDHFIDLYEKSLHYLDDHVGRLITHIQNSGYGDNTLIVLVADHGEEFLDHGRWGHWESNLFDEILVLIIDRGPAEIRDQFMFSNCVGPVHLQAGQPAQLELKNADTTAGSMEEDLLTGLHGGKTMEHLIRREPVQDKTNCFGRIDVFRHPNEVILIQAGIFGITTYLCE
jgi:hypothetical protein